MVSRPFIPAENCASAELIYQTGAFFMENTLHVQFFGEPGLSDLQNLRAELIGWDLSYWRALRHNSISLVRVVTRSLHAEDAPFEDYPLSAAQAGTNPTALQPLNVTFCVKFVTGFPGRSRRGRLFTPGICANQLAQAQGVLTAIAANAYVAALNALILALPSDACQLCVVSYRSNHAWRDTALVTVIDHPSYTDLYTDSQRRRLPGRGAT